MTFSGGKSALLSSSGFLKWGILSRLISSLYVHLNCGCHGSDRRRPSTQETTRQSSFQRQSGAFFFSFYSCFIGLQVAVMFKCRTTLNTLVEILSALHLALFLCSVWSPACTILRWIFSFWRKLHKGGASIIHDARFRFVPHCSESENSPPCYFAEEPWISSFFLPPSKFDVQFNNF